MAQCRICGRTRTGFRGAGAGILNSVVGRRTDLVLAVAVASCWSSGHLECCFGKVALLANWCVDEVEVEVE